MRSIVMPSHRASRRAVVAATLVVGVVAALVLTARGRADGAPAGVAIAKFAFAPKEITVAPGTKVVWTNRDETPHTVSATDRSFASKGMDTGDTYEHAFAEEGDFAYFCTVHPYMTGVVHVRKP